MEKLADSLSTMAGRPVRNFRGGRVLWERIQAALTPNDWPAQLVERLGASLEVRTLSHRIEVPGWPAPRPLRIAFASDLHAGPYTPMGLLTRAAHALAATAPDLLLLGGDFVCLRSSYAERVAAVLRDVPAPLGRYAVLGNHDYWAGAQPIVRALERVGIEVLINASPRLPPPFANAYYLGLGGAHARSADCTGPGPSGNCAVGCAIPNVLCWGVRDCRAGAFVGLAGRGLQHTSYPVKRAG